MSHSPIAQQANSTGWTINATATLRTTSIGMDTHARRSSMSQWECRNQRGTKRNNKLSVFRTCSLPPFCPSSPFQNLSFSILHLFRVLRHQFYWPATTMNLTIDTSAPYSTSQWIWWVLRRVFVLLLFTSALGIWIERKRRTWDRADKEEIRLYVS